MSELGHVLILAGGLSHEREVSLRSGRRVAEALADAGISVEIRDVGPSLVAGLRADPPSVVLPTLHGAAGEDGAIRDVLEVLGVPFVGTTAAAARVAFDKPVAKAVVAGAGVSTPRSVALPHATFRELGAPALLESIVAALGLPLVVKPARGGSALGMSVVSEPAQLPAALVEAYAYGDTTLIETKVTGTEVAVSLVDLGDGPQPLPPVEIVPRGGKYDYNARYTPGATEFFAPARLPDDYLRAATETALATHAALGLRDLSRTDLIVDRDGRPWFLEVAVAPGLTRTSLLPQAAHAGGLPFGDLWRDLLSIAAARG